MSNLSEEEKKAIEQVRLMAIGDFVTWFSTDGFVKMELATKTILNLIEKQQKELEQEKEKNKKLIEGKFREVTDKNSYIKDNYISKDKAKRKINELDAQQRNWIEDRTNKHSDAEIIYAREVLKELLEEE